MGEYIEIATPDGVAEAYVARPADGGHPPVLFCMDAIGIRPRIEEMVDRIAGWGYVVMAPNTFYREGTIADVAPTTDLRVPENRAAFVAGVKPRLAALTPERIVRDAAVYLERLLALPGVRGGTAGITGYCMGGPFAVRTAAEHPDVVAAVGSFHGGNLATDRDDSPHRRLPDVRAELYFAHADHDHSMTAEQIDTLERALSEAGLVFTSELYAGAAHGFTMADSAPYDEAAAERHFVELEALLDRTLAG